MLEEEVALLVNFYAFTGCDTVSALCGKGKLNPIKVMSKFLSLVTTQTYEMSNL